MTERQFVKWAVANPTVRAEWIGGEVQLLSPENIDHDELHTCLTTVLNYYVRKKRLGSVHGPNFWIRLPKQHARRMPDLLFVAKSRRAIVHRTVVEGAPDAAIEIVSPESQSRDRRDKYHAYEKAGVREYWIIDPVSRTFEAYTLRGSSYVAVGAEESGEWRSRVITGFFIKPSWLWRRPLPTPERALKELGAVK
jgi:Uma2 family endonuclease